MIWSESPGRPGARRPGPARRALAGGSAVAALGLLIAGCGAGDQDGGAGGAGGWTYTDARGTEVSLPERPERIVAHASAASALIPLGITPVGVFGDVAMDEDPSLEGLDTSGITSVGASWGEVNVEAMAELEPDLVVTGYYPLEKQVGGFDPENSALVDNVEEVAPIASVKVTQPATGLIDDYIALGEKLGADLEAPEVAQDRADFESAVGDLKAALKDKPGLSAMAVSPTDQFYVANPADFPEFQDYRKWGLDLVVPENVEKRGYFEALSWERLDTYQADLVLYDGRAMATPPKKLAETQPTWRKLAAVEADQLAPWYTDTYTSHRRYAEHLRTLTKAVGNADDGVVRE
ncbi:iron complex transport system substrate-binding protein [Murinocardiopsis flavida]|uniref:Iron complex transport system substrate-binding protein n=1 Tax=Murinocardiopsis flavida TaxID=645275 RepID=A0A2P8DMZ3_9ACTN|nr:ABC transporter substrate-binding protein [Murinocardiopsis flavida]PSK98588.1 iron complex transport system substrate-binding protein [Murinocardiopsis flavida]